MKKLRIISAVMMCALILGGTGVLAAEEGWTVVKSPQKFVVNGKAVEAGALNIDGYNYIKVAEFAELLDISVSFDEATNTVVLDKTHEYADNKDQEEQDRLLWLLIGQLQQKENESGDAEETP